MKKKIAIIAGGDSGEFEVSVNSARVVSENLDKSLFEVYLINIRGSHWVYKDSEGISIIVDKNDFSIQIGRKHIRFDCVFNAIHGTPGEDGKLQGYFDILGIPYTSCDLTTSALTFNKFYTNKLMTVVGIKVADSVVIRKGDLFYPQNIIDEVGLPCFVKPNAGGSSVGTSRVNQAEFLGKAIDIAFVEGDEVLVEAFIPGREITCGVLRIDGEERALPLTEIVSKNEFFDYEAKYNGMSEEITPARVSIEIENECRATSLKLYKTLNCKGIVRFDYIVNDDGMFFLEVNTVPGLTEASIVPQQAAHAGISLTELFTYAIEDALNS